MTNTPKTAAKALEAAIDYAIDVAEEYSGVTMTDGPPDTTALTLSKLRELGWVIVPVEPTQEMATALYEALHSKDRPTDCDLLEAVSWLYRAMIAATGECAHDWVSCDNSVVTGGLVCTKCHMIKAAKESTDG